MESIKILWELQQLLHLKQYKKSVKYLKQKDFLKRKWRVEDNQLHFMEERGGQELSLIKNDKTRRQAAEILLSWL